MTKMKRVAKYSGIIITGLIMLVAFFILLTLCLGWRIDTVLSGSMSPTLKVGEVVMTQPVDPKTIEVGDIITFRSPLDGKPICHRVVGIQENSPLYFQTKGDASEDLDPYLVPAQNLVGRIRFHTPLLAYIGSLVRSPLGFTLLIGLPGVIVIGMEIKNISNVIAEKKLTKRAEWRTGLRRED